MPRWWSSFLLCWLLGASALAQPEALSSVHRVVAESVPHGRGAEVDRSYAVSNEWGHRVYFDSLDGLGGAFIGVGADQNYTMAAAAGAEMLWLVDYDPTISRLHLMYRALITSAETRDALLAFFERSSEAPTAERIATELAEHPDRDRAVRVYRRYRNRLRTYLQNLRGFEHGRNWLNDDAMYAHIRALHLGGRVVARTGDVTGPTTLRAIGVASRQMGLTVRAVYLSNAEMFFPNRPSVLTNMRALPTDERTILLRTVFNDRLPVVRYCRWHYVVQPFSEYLARLETGDYFTANSISEDLVRERRRAGSDGFTVMGATFPMHSSRVGRD